MEDLDGIVLDTEHGIFNLENLVSCIQVITLKNKKCFVRVTEFNKTLIRNVLDCGAHGIIFSTIEQAFESGKMISYCNYPKNHGNRGCALTRENDWGLKNLGVKKPILIAQIETLEALDNLEYIKKDKFDFFLIGPYDLSSSMLSPGDFTNPSFLKSLQIINKHIEKDKLGIFLPTLNNIKVLKNELDNYSFFIVGMDTHFISQGFKELNKSF
jgi:2-keto-3-deoxy-L-rhamnonate aldolase RhmA